MRYKLHVVTIIAGMIALPSLAFANAPGIPEQFYGTVKYDSGVTASGSIINALINGVVVATTAVQNGGNYGSSPSLFFIPDADGTLVAGSTITFTVNGVVASPTTTFANAILTHLDLTVPSASIIITPTTNGDGTKSGVQTNAITTTTNDGALIVAMPANLTISGPSGWNGTVTLPTATTTYIAPPTSSGFNVPSVTSAIEIGAGDTPLTLSQAVKLTFTGQAGKLIGWSQAGTFHQITATCDSATSPTLAAGADCAKDVGSDLVVWTKHFTTFLTYTQTAIPASTPTPAPSSGGGGGGGGGGGSISTTATVNTITPPVTPVVAVITPATTPTQGTVLGAATYNFAKNLSVGSRGDDVTALQQFLSNNKFFSGSATGYFGQLTKTAVIAFQKARGIAPVGNVGPLTRAELNKGVVTTTEVAPQTSSNPTHSSLTSAQASAIMGLLQAFGADATVIANVRAALGQ